MNTFAVVDLETTGNSANKGDRIIEIAIVIYQEGQIIKQYSQLVNPNQHISRFISYLTGITNEMVSDQPTFAEIAEDVYHYFDNVYFVAHNVPFDLGFLNYELKQAGLLPITQPVIDTVELSRILLPQAPSFKLGHLSEWLNIVHDDPHRALSDARVTTKLLDHLFQKLNTLPQTTIKHLQKLEPDLKSHLEAILLNHAKKTNEKKAVNEQFSYAYNLAFKSFEQDEQIKEQQKLSFGAYLDHLFSEQSKLKKLIPNYEKRPGQREMAESIFHAFQSEQHALIEAGTGTGKTLAYLIAACFQATQYDQKVLISTYLIQLQEQLLNQEWQQLKNALPFHCQVAVLKGKSHYLNLEKFNQALHEESYNYDQVLSKAIVLVWLTETSTGDFDEIQLPSSGYQLIKRISTSNDTNFSQNDDSFANIYYQTAKNNAKAADLLIINHSLLADAMKREDGLLSLYDKLIIDEAHHLEHVIASQYGLQSNSISLHKKLKSIEQFVDYTTIDDRSIKRDLQRFIAVAIEENDLLFNYLYHYVNRKRGKNTSKNDLGRAQILIEDQDHPDWYVVVEMAERLEFALYDLIRHMDHLKFNDFNQMKKVLFSEELVEVKQTISEFFRSTSQYTNVKWLETDRLGTQKSVYLYQQPLNIDQSINDHLINHLDSIVFTSASLSVSGSFSFIKSELGLLEHNVIEHKIPSPYDLQDQVQLLIPNDFPILKFDDLDPFIEATCEFIFTMADLTSGRMLILFNSYDMLTKAYFLLRELFDDQYLLIAQGITSGSHERLKKNFQNFERSILLGTNAFWEGLDIPGDDLTAVVIVRLPFDSPNHPVVKQKHDLITADGKNPFSTHSLPNAVIRFKQGFGRLIRSNSDRGIIVVCDDRIMTKSYGKTFIDSIPNVPIYHRRTNELLELTNEWL